MTHRTSFVFARSRNRRAGLLCRSALALMCLVPAALPAVAVAQSNPPDKENLDARLEGYERKMFSGTNGTSPTWMYFFGLVVLACAGLFKAAKREP